MNILKRIHSFYVKKTSKFFRQGLPFIATIVAAPFFLTELKQLEYDAKKGRTQIVSPGEAKKQGIHMALTSTEIEEARNKREEEMQRFMKETIDNGNDDWENIRGPRPEEDAEFRQELDEENRAAILKAMQQKQKDDNDAAKLVEMEDKREALRRMRSSIVGKEEKKS